MNKNLLAPLAVLCAAGTVHAQLVDFDTAGDLAANFAGFSDFAESLSGGIAGSGGVALSANSQIAVYQTPISSIANVSVSVFFQYQGATGTGRGGNVGFTASATDTYGTSNNSTGTDIRVTVDGDGAGSFGMGIHNDGVQITTTAKDNVFSVGSWYRLELVAGAVSGGDILNVTGNLYDQSGVLLDTISGGTMTNGLASDNSIFAYFGGQNPTTRAFAAADDFAVVIPEPSLFGLMAGVLALGLVVHRRRRAA